MKRFVITACCLLLCCLLLEGVAFQYDALRTRGQTPLSLELAAASITREEIIQETDDVTAVMPSTQRRGPLYRTAVTWENLDLRGLRGAALDFEGKPALMRVELTLRDDSYALSDARADSLPALPGQTAYAKLAPHGTLKRLTVTFETEDESASLDALVLNAPVPYRFSLLRFTAMVLPALFLAAVLCFGWWRIMLDRNNPRHRLAYALTALLCAGLIAGTQFLITPADRTPFPYTRALEYPFENSVYQYRSLAHAVMYDALAKGQLAVDAQPDEVLLSLENPYDPTQRLESGAEVMFDYALYGGHYYAYFGLAPVLVFYAPFRLVTGHLPAYTTAGCFFALLTAAAAFLCVGEALRRWQRTPSLLLACLGALAVALGSNLLMLQACADRYHLSIACMQTFFYLTVWTALVAVRQKGRGRRTAAFIACALCTGLLAASRVTGALAAAGWVIPLFIGTVAGRKRPAARKAADAASYLLPLAACAGLMLAYNAARFGNPLEFGQTWQLTLEDVRQNRITLAALPGAVYSYFLQGLRTTAEFPFFTLAEAGANRTGNWFYGVANAGALTMPVTWGLLWIFALPEKARRGKLATMITAVAVTVPIALAGYCLAGVAQRYVCDILPTLCLAGMLCLTEPAARDAQQGRGHTTALACTLLAATCLIACSLVFSNYRGFVSEYCPEKYLELYNLFSIR